ncbi:MAG: DUF2062 domain-containing protein [Planctomycetota bacterium]
MILWIVKLLSSIRRAVAGRRYPSQLAWAVSFGLLLGVVPHGNLLAIAILIVVLSLRINHAMAGLTAVATSFLATRLDPYSHQIGDWVLAHPAVQEKAVAAWQLPLVPWTDLNNTVVMGSFLIGVAALCPVFMVTYPVFRLFAPKKKPEAESKPSQPSDTRKTDEGVHQIVLVDPSHQTVAAPHRHDEEKPERSSESAQAVETSKSKAGSSETGVTEDVSNAEATNQGPSVPTELTGITADSETAPLETSKQEDVDFVEIDHAQSDSAEQFAVETRIDVIRMQDHGNADASIDPAQAESAADSTEPTDQPIDEALNYLLRQLRDSQQRKAA